MEMLERDHRVHIKVHEQRVQNLEDEHKNAKGEVENNGDMSIQSEREKHHDRVLAMSKEKIDIKRDLREQQLEKEDDVKMMCQGFAKSLLKLRETFEQNHKKLENQYEKQVDELKIDLELRRKV